MLHISISCWCIYEKGYEAQYLFILSVLFKKYSLFNYQLFTEAEEDPGSACVYRCQQLLVEISRQSLTEQRTVRLTEDWKLLQSIPTTPNLNVRKDIQSLTPNLNVRKDIQSLTPNLNVRKRHSIIILYNKVRRFI